jgi:transposase
MAQPRVVEHYERLIGLEAPWKVEAVELLLEQGEVRIHVGVDSRTKLSCPECGGRGRRHDTRERHWRHLDTMQYRTILVGRIPRVRCQRHGVVQVAVPWAEAGSRFTALFEALAIDWLQEASLSAVGRQLRITWDEADGIQARAVRRGLARRELEMPAQIGVDETSFQRRHEYVTVVSDLKRPRVVYVADDRKKEGLDAFFRAAGPEACARVESVATDMWEPYIQSIREFVPDAERKIVFDKFHIAKHLGEAVDRVRKQEQRELRAEGDERLVKTKYLWLQNPDHMSRERWVAFQPLRHSTLRVARAWALKETAMALWGYRRLGWARRAWDSWLSWAVRCRLEPMRRVAWMIKRHYQGVLNAAVSGVTNAVAEGFNAKIQWIKRTACGFRNRERFRNAIYFHLGGLDLYPARTHPIS